jgi:hypothetical protein
MVVAVDFMFMAYGLDRMDKGFDKAQTPDLGVA